MSGPPGRRPAASSTARAGSARRPPARSKKPRSISPNWARIPRSTEPSSVSIAQSPSRIPSPATTTGFTARFGSRAMALAPKLQLRRGHPQPHLGRRGELPQSHPHRAGQQQRVHLRLAAQNAGSHRQRQLHHLMLHRVQILVAFLGKALHQFGGLPHAPLLRGRLRRHLCLALGLAALLPASLAASSKERRVSSASRRSNSGLAPAPAAASRAASPASGHPGPVHSIQAGKAGASGPAGYSKISNRPGVLPPIANAVCRKGFPFCRDQGSEIRDRNHMSRQSRIPNSCSLFRDL